MIVGRSLIAAAICSLAVLALAACGDGDSGSDATPTPRVTLAPEEPTATPTATRVPGGEGPAVPTPPPIEGDGRLAFISDHTGNNEIWAVDPDGTDLVQLTDTPEQESSVYWAPGGETIGFTRFAEDGTLTFHEMDANGGNERESDEATLQGWVTRLEVSNDGNVRLGDGEIVDANGDQILQLNFPVDSVGDVMVMSPDGTKVTLGLAREIFEGLPQDEISRIVEEEDQAAVLSLAENEFEVAVIDVATGVTQDVTQSLGRDWLPVWAPDSTRIAYLGRVDQNAPAGIYVVDANGENPGEIFPPPECDGCAGVTRVQWSR